MDTTSPTIERLEQQINWYGKKGLANQGWYKRLKLSEIVAAALVPLFAGFPDIRFSHCIIGSLGVLIIILEGFQHVNQYQHNWMTYRSMCEALKHEKFLWLAKAGPYDDNPKADVLLAERVESLIAQEHSKWVSTREHAAKDQKGGG